MQYALFLISTLVVAQPEALGAGDHKRTITVDELKRHHWVHVPTKYDAKQPTPVVLALHGAMMDGKMMEAFTGLSAAADKHGFIVVYPNGTGPGGLLQTWNAGKFPGELNGKKADDVKYLGKVLDDVESAFNVDKKRIFVTGLSNGGMMSYRLANEMSERIAAIAPVAGTMTIEKFEPKRPISVVHFHGTKDSFVPFNGPVNKEKAPAYMKFHSVEETINACRQANGCKAEVKETVIEPKADKLKVIRKDYGVGKQGAEVVLYVIENGGHVWPGMTLNLALLGQSTNNINANDVMWEFFQRHALK
jgi:polyhydroxybutyrate depolymerase